MFTAVKSAIYFDDDALELPEIYLNEIRLAIDAMSVPSPPMFVPIISSRILSVKPDNSRAAGTLLTTWLVTTDVTHSLPPIIPRRSSLKTSILPILPMNTKNATKVTSSE